MSYKESIFLYVISLRHILYTIFSNELLAVLISGHFWFPRIFSFGFNPHSFITGEKENINFDFLINGHLIRSKLGDFVAKNKIQTVSYTIMDLSFNYIETVPPTRIYFIYFASWSGMALLGVLGRLEPPSHQQLIF